MELEQIKEVLWATITTLIAPAMGASLAVMIVIRLLGGQRFSSLATLLAITAAVLVGGVFIENPLSDEKPWRFDTERPLNLTDFCQVVTSQLEKKPTPKDEEPASPSAEEDPPSTNRLPLYWLPYLVALAMLMEYVLPSLAIPAGPAWAVRTVLALFAGWILSYESVRIEHPWISWALGLTILLEWALLTWLAKRWLDGTVPTGLGVCCVMTYMVLALLAGYATAYNLAFLFGAALAGPALVAWKWPSDTSPAIAAIAVALPGLLLVGYSSRPEPPPYGSFVLAALAPLALLPMCLPFLAKSERWSRWLLGLALPFIPAVIAAVWAMQASTPVTP